MLRRPGSGRPEGQVRVARLAARACPRRCSHPTRPCPPGICPAPQVVPAFEGATQAMFQQMNSALAAGLEEHLQASCALRRPAGEHAVQAAAGGGQRPQACTLWQSVSPRLHACPAAKMGPGVCHL